jgi:hypothetical protein
MTMTLAQIHQKLIENKIIAPTTLVIEGRV